MVLGGGGEARAEERSSEGTAYAVLTSAGELILFRSNETYQNGPNKTATDIFGNTYNGQLYGNIENRSQNGSENPSWHMQMGSVKQVRIAEGQKISPINCAYWFYNSSIVTCDLHGLDTSNTTNMSYMFYGCDDLNELDISFFNTENVTNMSKMFRGCNNLTVLRLNNWNTNNVINMQQMFYACHNIHTLEIGDWRTGNVSDMSEMFYQCRSLHDFDISDWNVQNVTDMSSMFFECSGLTSFDASGWNTGNVTDMSYMFYGCSGLTSFDASGWDTGNVTDMSRMFESCSELTNMNISNWNTLNVTNMSQMFYKCSKLNSLDLCEWNTINVTIMNNMFAACQNLTSLDIQNFNINTSVANVRNMFPNNQKLSSVSLGVNFSFKGRSTKAVLPTPPTQTTTGKWISEDGRFGPYTPAQLRDNYDGSLMAGTWIWQEIPTKYTIKFVAPNNSYAGTMLDQKNTAAEAATIDKNEFYRFNYHFDHWDGSDGITYADQATIPANHFAVGDTLTLTAVFEKDDNSLSFTDGKAHLYIKGGVKANLSGIPGGTNYQIWEDTPSGWQLIAQSDVAGTVPANGQANASFTNEYVPGTATITLLARKTLDGLIPAGGHFTFQLLQDGNVIEEVTNSDTGLIQFTQLVFRAPGTYTYQIKEVRGDDAGIVYDTHTESITIQVDDDGQGNLTAISSVPSGSIVFENETKPGVLTVTKETDGGGTGDEVFIFDVYLTNEYGQALDNFTVVGGEGPES